MDPEQEEASDIALAFAEKLLLAGAEADVAFDDEGEIKLIDEAKEQGDDALRVLLEKFGAKATSTLEGEEG